MEFNTVAVALTVFAAFMTACESSSISQIGSGSYTDTLIGGLNRFAKLNARSAIGVIDECGGLCPIGTVCGLDLGQYRCISRNGIAIVDNDYGNSGRLRLDISDGTYGAGIRINSGVNRIGGQARFANNGGYGSNNFAISSCGILAPECRSARRDLNAVIKYTFDHTTNRCVQVSVCMTCANFNSPSENLFDTRFQCARFCQ